MATKIKYALQGGPNGDEPARLLFSSVVVPSAAKLKNGGFAEPKRSATFGIGEKDFKALVGHMIEAIKSEMGTFSKPDDYYLACMSGETAAKRAIAKAAFDAQGKPADEAFKIKEKAEGYAAMYRQYAGILTANSKFDVSIARLEGGKVIDIITDGMTPEQLKKTEKDYFYRGAYVSGAIELSAFRRKTLDDKDGVTAYLQNVLFVRRGESLGGASAPNSSVFGGYTGYSDVDPTAMAPDGAAVEEASDF